MRTLERCIPQMNKGNTHHWMVPPRFSVQGLPNALADVGEGITKPPAEEYAMMLEVTMVDCPAWLHSPHSPGMWEW